jgi:predicted dehydrogenase
MGSERLRIGIVGCGDVTTRHYLPGIESMAGRVEVEDGCAHETETTL